MVTANHFGPKSVEYSSKKNTAIFSKVSGVLRSLPCGE